jgi:hypothetical protein
MLEIKFLTALCSCFSSQFFKHVNFWDLLFKDGYKEMRSVYKSSAESLEGKKSVECLGINKTTILKWISQK